jgi:hypothetical protein
MSEAEYEKYMRRRDLRRSGSIDDSDYDEFDDSDSDNDDEWLDTGDHVEFRDHIKSYQWQDILYISDWCLKGLFI